MAEHVEIINFSPLAADRCCLTDRHGAETLVISVKGTWCIRDGRKLELGEKQQPVILAAVYRGEPGRSSLRYESELALDKPGTDCVLLGNAYAQKPRTQQVKVTFAVGPLRKTALVFGNRYWTQTLGIAKSTAPEVFEKMPLIYENSFGGMDVDGRDPAMTEFCPENPVGKGFRSRKSKRPVEGLPLPNIEDPGDLIRKPDSRLRPVGFGFVASSWQPRLGFAGTYGESWRQDVCPLLPSDFDERFFCAASEGLTSTRHLTGTEEVLVENASPKGKVGLRLPGVVPKVAVRLGTQTMGVPVTLNTILIEPDESRLQLVWNGKLNVHSRIYDVRWIRIRMENTR